MGGGIILISSTCDTEGRSKSKQLVGFSLYVPFKS